MQEREHKENKNTNRKTVFYTQTTRSAPYAHVVLDELFRGANIRTYFGGTTIDLRHTHIASGETYIDLNCNWGGIELFIPSDWKVQIECNCFCGGCEDKRWKGAETKQEWSVLVIRGNISFGGIEIKD